jgi:hypothetical protein
MSFTRRLMFAWDITYAVVGISYISQHWWDSWVKDYDTFQWFKLIVSMIFSLFFTAAALKEWKELNSNEPR